MRNRPTFEPSRSLPALRSAIERTGYYPEVVADGIESALAGEDLVAWYVHHEPTIEHDEVRRHITVVALTKSRLILTHTDDHPGDELLPQHYTSTSSEAIALSSIRSVVVTRMVPDPGKGAAPAAEAVLSISWGGVGRIDLEPATCGDPQCEADHGYSGVLSGDDFSLRVSAAAEGHDAVNSMLEFARELSAHTYQPTHGG